MATHDYVIANGTGAAVRSDLNNALAAIVSNNSSATEPTTTYAYMWWADTTAGQLKLRNAADDGWIVIQELDGTMLMEDGTAAAPGLAFASDLDTGIYRPTTNALGIATNGTAAIYVDASQKVGLGTSSPAALAHLANTSSTAGYNFLQITAGGESQVHTIKSTIANGRDLELNTARTLKITTGSNTGSFPSEGHIQFSHGTNGELARIDSSGRLLVSTSTARANYFNNASAYSPQLQIEGTGTSGQTMMSITSGSTSLSGYLIFARQKSGSIGGNTAVANNDSLGSIQFQGSDGSEFVPAAYITAEVDGTPGANDMPGRLMFFTTADGSASPTERMRITSNGSVGFASGITLGSVTPTAGGFYSTAGVLGTGAGTNAVKFSTTTGKITYDTSSRLNKTDIEDCPYGIAEVKQLLPRRYYRTDDERLEVGFVADEVASVLPEFVPFGPKSAVTGNEDDTEVIPVNVNYDKLTAVLTKALQEAIHKIETLEAKVAALEAS